MGAEQEETGGINVAKILEVYVELANDPDKVPGFQKNPDEYRRYLEGKGLSEADIAYMTASASQPPHVMLTVWPRPPTVWTPPTVFG
jgi:hypothetical protein